MQQKKKLNKNWLIAGKRNWTKCRLVGLKINLVNLLYNATDSNTITSDEIIKLKSSIDFIDNILINLEKSYNEIRQQHNFKTYEQV